MILRGVIRSAAAQLVRPQYYISEQLELPLTNSNVKVVSVIKEVSKLNGFELYLLTNHSINKKNVYGGRRSYNSCLLYTSYLKFENRSRSFRPRNL